MNVQLLRFQNMPAWNNPRRIEMPIKTITKAEHILELFSVNI